MSNVSKILLLGASGRTGKLILEITLASGYHVNCLVRNPEKVSVKNEKLVLFKGTPANPEQLKKAMEGCESIINVLNISRTSDFPWAKLRTPETFLSDVMQQLIKISEGQLKRIIICTAWGVNETRDHIPFWFKWLIDYSNIGVAYRDHEKQETMIEASNIPWTIVRPVGLTNSQKAQKVIQSFDNQPKPGLTISRQSVAEFMVDALQNDELIGRKPVISAM